MSDVKGVGQKVPDRLHSRVAAAGPLAPVDRGLLEQMYRDHGPVVWRIVYAWAGGDREVADDAVAEAFVRAGRRLDSIRDSRRWLIVTALNAAKAELRHRAVVSASGEAAVFAGAGLSGSAGLPGLELAQLIARLPLAQRTAVLLCDVFGYPAAEIAVMTGRSGVAVRVHLHRARARLRDLLRECD